MLRVRAEKHGEVVLRVSLPSLTSAQPVDDFIRIRTRSAIQPASPVLHVGARPCFSTFLETSAEPGVWSSVRPLAPLYRCAMGE